MKKALRFYNELQSIQPIIIDPKLHPTLTVLLIEILIISLSVCTSQIKLRIVDGFPIVLEYAEHFEP